MKLFLIKFAPWFSLINHWEILSTHQHLLWAKLPPPPSLSAVALTPMTPHHLQNPKSSPSNLDLSIAAIIDIVAIILATIVIVHWHTCCVNPTLKDRLQQLSSYLKTTTFAFLIANHIASSTFAIFIDWRRKVSPRCFTKTKSLKKLK